MFTRRVVIFFLVLLAAFGVISVRLVQLQIFAHQDYLEQAEDVMLRPPVLLPSIRGQIFDRRGKLLAGNIPCFDLAIHYGAISLDETYIERVASSRARYRLGRAPKPQELQPYIQQVRSEIEDTWPKLSALDWYPGQSGSDFDSRATLLKDRRRDIIKKVESIRRQVKLSLQKRQDEFQDDWLGAIQAQAISRRITSLVLREELSFLPMIFELDNGTARHIQAVLDSPEWITLVPTTRRVYPYGYVAAQTIGSVGPVRGDDLKEFERNSLRPQLEDPYRAYAPDNDIIGWSGVERGYDWRVLRGRRGIQQKDRLGNLVPGGNLAPQAGTDLHLTIDIALQADIEKAMPKDSPGAAVVLDIGTGEVLALVSTPLLARGDSKPPSIDGNDPWLNRAVEARYPPGSTVKPVVILAGLSERHHRTGLPIITPETIFHCPTNEFIKPKCFYPHGSVNPFDAIKRSCNIYCSKVAERIRSVLPIWFSDFGLARRTPLFLPRENAGTMPGLVSQESIVMPRLEAWQARQLAIGQGSLTVTPLQVANMMATLARRGVYLPPSLDLAQEQLREPVSPAIDPAAMDLILEAMQAVVNEPGGTAHGVSQLHRLDFRVAGKTGTAQYGSKDLEDWRCWFSGFAPADNPQIAFAVVIEHGRTGGSVAGPVAAELLRLCAQHGYIKTVSSGELSLQSSSGPRY
ncbi:MAG: hypothetical protein GWP14_05550 [Actinobacteria bacterium]|nr:hypothetical protein [Actinomycetota bacterium]